MKKGMCAHAQCHESVCGEDEVQACLNRSSASLQTHKVADILRIVVTFLGFALFSVFAPSSFAAITPGATPGNFGVSESGAATYSVPIAVPPGTAGMEPKISLNYSSQGGNGLLGMGWSLGGLSVVHRCSKTVVQDGVLGSVNYDANDRFCLDGQRLIVVTGAYGADATEYRTEIESFSRIISYGSQGSGPAYWKVWTKSGQILEFGNTGDSRIEAQGKTEVMLWALNKTSDTVGNYFTVAYTEDNPNGQFYPARIDYTGNTNAGQVPYNSVRFVYESRPDVVPVYHAGSLSNSTVRLKNAQTYIGDIALTKDYRLAYDVSPSTSSSRLVDITECAADDTCMVPTTMQWPTTPISAPAFSEAISSISLPCGAFSSGKSADFNGDGKSDLLGSYYGRGCAQYVVSISNGLGAFGTSYTMLDNVLLSSFSWVGDQNGDGKSDFIKLISSKTSGFYTWLANDSGGFSSPVSNTILNFGWSGFWQEDINGDGRQDYVGYLSGTLNTYLSIGGGTYSTTSFGPVNLDGLPVWTGDYNGDGKQDLLSFSGSVFTTFFSKGDGTYNVTQTTSASGWSTTAAWPGDFNGDGKQDLLSFSGSVFTTFFSKGDGTYNVTQTTSASGWSTTAAWPGDFNGDGKSDLLSYANGYLTSLLSNTSAVDILVSVSNGLGAKLNITYKPLTDTSVYTKGAGAVYPMQDVQAPMYVVSETATDDGAGSQFRMTYRYGGMKASQDGRGMLGFRTVEVTDPQSGIVNRREYRQDYPYIGLPTLATQTSAGGVELSRIENTYAEKLIVGAGKFPYLAYSKAQSRDLNGVALPYTETWNETFDDWGNATKITVKTSDGFATWSDNTYTNDASKWLLGRLSRAVVSKSINGGTTQTRTSAFAYNASNGLLTQEIIEPDQPAFRLVTDYQYDAYGNKTKATVSGGDAVAGTSFTARSTDTAYDSKGRFPLTTINALGHAETRVYDERFGLIKSLTGPNLLTTTWSYDGFGRKTLETRADATQTTWSYADCVSACGFAKYSVTVTNTGTAPVVSFYDQLNRLLRTVGTGFDGQTLYADTEYDNRGRVKRSSRPYFANATSYWTTPTYDELGRTTRVDAPDGSFSSMAYNGLTGVATNSKGQTKTELKNSLGQTVSVTDNAAGITTYTYDPFGNLTHTSPAGGGLLLVGYDLRGRKISSTDPDMGSWSYAYNALGELIKQTDAKNQAITLTYDLLGRIKTRVEPGMTSTWTYDNAANGKGKVARVVSDSVTKAFTYDSLGRNTRVATAVDSKIFNQDTSYDSLGRVLTQTRPSGFATKNLYSATGYHTELRNADASNALLWKALTLDAEGRITQTQYGNGVVNTRTYQAQNGYLTSIQANAPNSTVLLQNQSYTYDSLGNLTAHADPLASSGRTEAFQYDSLNRLTQASLTQGGIAQPAVTISYNALGNITSKSDVGTYTYHATQIHAVISAGKNTYAYDANGNLTGGGGRALTWTSWNLPASDTYGGASTTWGYDADHVRIKQIIGVKTTYYLNPRTDLGGHYEEEHYSGGRIDKIHSLYAGGQLIGQVITTNQSGVATKTRYFHPDHLGSISVVTGESGAVTARNTYDAWGKRQTVAGQRDGVDQGYTGHEHLEDGLIHMNGRLYDPVLGRFISADPYIQDPSNGQGFNRYSYVNNNPLSFTDPSGFWSLGDALEAGFNFSFNPSPKNTFEFIRSQPGQKAVDRYIMTHQWAYSVGQGAATFFTAAFCGGCGGAAWSAYYTYAATGSGNAAFKAGAITFATAAAFYGAGQIGAYLGDGAGLIAHAVVGCASAAASGGNCGAGALSAGFSKLGTIAFDGYDGGIGGLIASSVIGGTASVLGGGKFANGAMTGAFGYLFNELAHRYRVGPTTLCTVGQSGCTMNNSLSVVDRYSTAGLESGSNGPVAGLNMLMGDNPIDHRVDRVNFTITNTTLPGHDFYPGTVVHSLSMDAASQWSWSNFSFQSVQVINLTTVGTGTGPYGWFNNMVGPVLFNSTHRNSRNELQRQAR